MLMAMPGRNGESIIGASSCSESGAPAASGLTSALSRSALAAILVTARESSTSRRGEMASKGRILDLADRATDQGEGWEVGTTSGEPEAG